MVEINSLPMQETPPYGQLNRKEIYTPEGKLLVSRPDAPVSESKIMGHYEEHDGVRTFMSPDGDSVSTAIQWLDGDHFFFEFSPGERWYYARVTAPHPEDAQWEPRSVAVIRTTDDPAAPTLRDFPYDLTDDSSLPWEKRVVGAWETIRVAGSAVSGPDTPPYGMPNDRLLIAADGTIQKVRADGESDPRNQAVHFTVDKNQLTLIEPEVTIAFWFNRWGQLVFEQRGLQTTFKRISLDPQKAPPGPFIVVLLSGERESPTLQEDHREVKKSAVASISPAFPAKTAAEKKNQAVARPKATFRKPFNGRSQPADLALSDDNDTLQHENEFNLLSQKKGLGSTSDIVETNASEKYSVIRADAIDSTLEVPFGWHVADNGRRMLVFDPDHFIEISIEEQTAKNGPKALLQETLESLRAQHPELKSQLMENSGNSFLLILQNLKEQDEIKTRSFMTKDIGQGAKILVAEISAAPTDLVRALNLAEVLTRHLKYQP